MRKRQRGLVLEDMHACVRCWENSSEPTTGGSWCMARFKGSCFSPLEGTTASEFYTTRKVNLKGQGPRVTAARYLDVLRVCSLPIYSCLLLLLTSHLTRYWEKERRIKPEFTWEGRARRRCCIHCIEGIIELYMLCVEHTYTMMTGAALYTGGRSEEICIWCHEE